MTNFKRNPRRRIGGVAGHSQSRRSGDEGICTSASILASNASTKVPFLVSIVIPLFSDGVVSFRGWRVDPAVDQNDRNPNADEDIAFAVLSWPGLEEPGQESGSAWAAERSKLGLQVLGYHRLYCGPRRASLARSPVTGFGCPTAPKLVLPILFSKSDGQEAVRLSCTSHRRQFPFQQRHCVENKSRKHERAHP